MRGNRAAWIRLGLSGLLLVTAVVFGGQAAYATAKAQLAQVLLLTAWNRSESSAQPVKPWPWADTHPTALLEVPRLDVRQVVLAGHSGEAMAFGPGLIAVEDSYVLGGHRDSHLAFLQHIEPGEELLLSTTDSQRARFIVQSMQVVDATLSPDFSPPHDSLTLITCYPFDALTAGGPLRLIVTAFRDNPLR